MKPITKSLFDHKLYKQKFISDNTSARVHKSDSPLNYEIIYGV